MKFNTNAIRVISLLSIVILMVISCKTLGSESISLFFNLDIKQHEFAANDIKAALKLKNYSVEFKDLSDLTNNFKGKKIVIAQTTDKKVHELLKKEGGASTGSLGEQAYSLRTTTTQEISYWIIGGDENGAMYGGLQIAENINFNGLEEIYNDEVSPYLKNRGIKFNIPLDKESPTYFYSTDGTSHRVAISNVWDFEFWKTWFDEMARHRYNVLSLWSPHPFTSMLNMEDEYPGIAINGVKGYDEKGNEIQVNNMNIDEKVEFWQKVMEYGHDRGFGIYFCTWNIFLSTADGKHGLEATPNNQNTKTYLKKCMVKFLETYPLLKGFGITVGERMGKIDDAQKEKWAWDTYGIGMMEYAKANPNRNLVFIHRQHDGNLQDILKYFKPLSELPNIRFDLSFKYSQAHAHTTVTPSKWSKNKMEDGLGPNGLMSWLTIRNDDFYFLHWADPNYVRDYIKHFPEVNKFVIGFYIGADGWVFTRDFVSKDPYYKNKNALSIERTWYMQKLWGRISYNPSVSDELFKNHLAFKYPEVSSEDLFEAWSNASGAIRLANEQVTGKWDLDMDWWPEGWTGDEWKGKGHFYSLNDTREAIPYDGSNLCSFSKTAKNECGDKVSAWITADKIDTMASKALSILATLDCKTNKELKLNLKDIEAQANLGLYNAYKFRAAIYLEKDMKIEAKKTIGTAYCYWKNYTTLMDGLYKAVDLQRNLNFSSWHDHDEEALKDYLDLGGKGEPEYSLSD